VEADIAQRARDLVERKEERDAVARARMHMDRLRAAAADGGPVEAAWEATGKAVLARVRGRSDAGLWRAAAERWEAVSRPYEAATNRQIGASLFMAEKTASVHVSCILAKLGVSRRTEAAAVAHRMGLATAGLAGARPR